MGFSKIAARDIEGNFIKMLEKDWMLVTAGDKNGFNTMTAAWGGFGRLWAMDVATYYIRPQRYTYEFTEKSDYCTLAFFGENYRDELALCGSKSGRDIDKVKECGFEVAFADCGAPYFLEAELVVVCKKLYFDDFDPKNFLDSRIAACYYPDDYHRVYIGEIIEVLKRD